MSIIPAIFGVATTKLNANEIALFEQAQPLGFILFARNIETPLQVKALVAEMKTICCGYTPLVLIDQEGGRVARLRSPHWQTPPAPKYYADMVATDGLEVAIQASYQGSVEIAETLVELGINVNCTPMCDVLFTNSHEIIGDRSYGAEPEQIIAFGRAVAQALLDNGVLPVIKHIPGHGRANVDSHEDLPIVKASLAELQTDFAPFKALADLPLAMTAHILYETIDAHQPATLSPDVINIIRNEIGFRGLLMTDDLCMKALNAPVSQLALDSLQAGCDIVLHCNGEFDEIESICHVLQAHDFSKEKLEQLFKLIS
jgi:beta-N-acetylhexosaminidase